MRHFLVNIEKISFSFFHSHGSSFPMWFQDELHSLLTLLSLTALRALLGATLSASLKFAAFCFIYHPDLYYCKPSEATTAIRASQDLLLVLSAPNEQHLESHTQSGFSQLQNPTLKSPYICPAGLHCEFCGSVQHKKPELA